MRKQIIEKTDTTIMANKNDTLGWSLCSLSSELYWWSEFFNIAFFKTQPVKKPIISFEKKSVKNRGHYMNGRNGFGIKENININRCHLDRPLWEILSTLLHEMCHSWQNQHGKPSISWFHNKEFKFKMANMGVVPNDKGHHIWVADPFVFFLEKHGIKFRYPRNSEGIIKVPQENKLKGKSKLKKWKCLCGQTARVGREEFYAICTLCEGEFVLAG